jgi:hypothetical protein
VYWEGYRALDRDAGRRWRGIEMANRARWGDEGGCVVGDAGSVVWIAVDGDLDIFMIWMVSMQRLQ